MLFGLNHDIPTVTPHGVCGSRPIYKGREAMWLTSPQPSHSSIGALTTFYSRQRNLLLDLSMLRSHTRKYVSKPHLKSRAGLLLAGLPWPGTMLLNNHNCALLARHASNYIICNDAHSVGMARKALQYNPYVLVDMEGHKRNPVNRSNDSLSIIQIGTPGASRVFLFDMRKLRTEDRRGVLSILAGPQIIKVGWGLPVDYEILRNGYNTTLSSVIDLQIVDILSRSTRGEGERERVARLGWRNMPGEYLLQNGLELDGIHVLNRMDAALQEHGIRGVPLKECRHSCTESHSILTSN